LRPPGVNANLHCQLVTYFRHKDGVDALDLITVARTFVGDTKWQTPEYSPTAVLF